MKPVLPNQQTTNQEVSKPDIHDHPMADFFGLKLKSMGKFFFAEHFSYWAICGYLFVEYVRPQSILRWLDILPWGKLFILMAMVGWFMDRRARWTADSLNKWMVMYLLVVIIAIYTAYWPELAKPHFMDFFSWFIIYFLIINIVNSEKRLFIFLLIFLFASFKLSQHGARTWTMRGFSFTEWGLMGPEGPFQNSGELAAQMVVMMPISYCLAIAMKPWLTRLKFMFMMLLPVTAAMTVMGASSRGSQIAMLFQLYHTFLRGRLSFKTISLVCLLGFAVYKMLPAEQLERFQTMGDDKPSQQRLLYWKNGLEMIKEHPVFGVGFYNFAPYFARHYPNDVLYKSAQLPHNIFVQVATDGGLVGLFVYLMLIWGGFSANRKIRFYLKNEKDHWLYNLSYGYDATFVGFLIAGQFVTIGYYPFMWIHLSFIIATKNVVAKYSQEKASATALAETIK